MWHWQFMGWWGWILMVLFWVGVAALAVWLVRQTRSGAGRSDPRTVLDERLARGEIDVDEYRRIKEELDAR